LDEYKVGQCTRGTASASGAFYDRRNKTGLYVDSLPSRRRCRLLQTAAAEDDEEDDADVLRTTRTSPPPGASLALADADAELEVVVLEVLEDPWAEADTDALSTITAAEELVIPAEDVAASEAALELALALWELESPESSGSPVPAL
jgi:hypothetical protein